MNIYKRHRFQLGAPTRYHFLPSVAHRELMPDRIHSTEQYENNRAKHLHEVTTGSGFLGVDAAVYNFFNLGRHSVRAEHYRDLRMIAFGEWSRAVA